MKQDIFAALQPRRSARNHHALVEARAGFGHWRGCEIEVDVIGDKQVQFSISIVINERAAGVPAFSVSANAGFVGDVGKCAVAVVVVQNIFTEVADEQIVVPIIVVVADADALSPSVMDKSGLRSNVGKSSIAIVFEKMRDRFVAGLKSLKPRTVHQKNVEPAVVVVIVESNPAAGGF